MRIRLFIAASALLVFAGCALGKIAFGPGIDARDVEAPTDAATLERGRYLANHVAACTSCHSTRDWRYFAAPVTPGTEGKGGERYDEATGFPGTLVSSNLTPSALGTWSDGEIFRAITAGVDRDGEALFPIMPYPHYRKLATTDALALVAWVRSLEPIEHQTPRHELNMPLNLIVNLMPAEHEGPASPPAPGDAGYPAYITGIASCISCHSLEDKGQPVEGMAYAGGREFPVPGYGVVRSSNITPHEVTGIGAWPKALFITRFKAMTAEAVGATALSKGDVQTVMPWTDYAGMSEADLGAIYDFLKTVPPVDNLVERFTPAAADGDAATP